MNLTLNNINLIRLNVYAEQDLRRKVFWNAHGSTHQVFCLLCHMLPMKGQSVTRQPVDQVSDNSITFHLINSERKICPVSTLRISIVGLIREGLGVLKKVPPSIDNRLP